MDERQLTVCAIALFADGYSKRRIAAALGVDEDRAQRLAERGAEEQAAGTMGHMAQYLSLGAGTSPRSAAMTNEEKDLLIAYLVDTGDIDPDGDVEAQFLEWYQVRDQVVSGEAHYKAVIEAAGYGNGATPVATGPAVASVGMNGPRPLGPAPWAHPLGPTRHARSPPRPTGLRPRHALRLLRRKLRCRPLSRSGKRKAWESDIES